MSKGHTSKYESAVELKRTRARHPWNCFSCGCDIKPRDYYYRQSLGLIRKPPRVRLNAFCLGCKNTPLAGKLELDPADIGKGSVGGVRAPKAGNWR